jgi:hypothetical protein
MRVLHRASKSACVHIFCTGSPKRSRQNHCRKLAKRKLPTKQSQGPKTTRSASFLFGPPNAAMKHLGKASGESGKSCLSRESLLQAVNQDLQNCQFRRRLIFARIRRICKFANLNDLLASKGPPQGSPKATAQAVASATTAITSTQNDTRPLPLSIIPRCLGISFLWNGQGIRLKLRYCSEEAMMGWEFKQFSMARRSFCCHACPCSKSVKTWRLYIDAYT